jgi:hypothetical protein
MNIVTDLALATIPTLMILPLQIDSGRRLTLLTGFWCRIMYTRSDWSIDQEMIANAVVRSVIVASAVQIGYLCALPTSEDLLNSIWRVVVCGKVIQVTSIKTSTIPFLKPFLVSLESGFLGASKVTRSTASAFDSRGDAGHPLIYIKIGS